MSSRPSGEVRRGARDGGPEAEIAEILRAAGTIAVVGLSPDEGRPSHGVARYLQEAGYRIIPINPRAERILGERCYAGLRDIPIPVDVVDIFRRPEFVPGVVEDAIAIGARAVWMQEGVIHDAAAARARAAGLAVVMDRCMLKEHRRLGGRGGGAATRNGGAVRKEARAMPEEKVGLVEKYFAHIEVAAITITQGGLRVGDTIHVVGHTTDFTQQVTSMQVEHAPVQEASPGQSVGIRVVQRARPHDVVYRVTEG